MTETGPAGRGIAPVNGAKLYYEVEGTGDPLLLLHAGCCLLSPTRSPGSPISAQAHHVSLGKNRRNLQF